MIDLTVASRTVMAISLGAIGGALARYGVTLWFTSQFGVAWYGTFFINVSGCFVMGVVVSLPVSWMSADLRLLLTTGFLGAYTTFSTYGLDAAKLLALDRGWEFGGYWLGSAALGLLAVQVGCAVGRWIG